MSSLDTTVREICEMGFIPSFCTACYRAGRTGEQFMKVAKSRFVHNFCIPNAIFTLKEYLLDYASDKNPGQRRGNSPKPSCAV
jgi:2-iminoacetate synthase